MELIKYIKAKYHWKNQVIINEKELMELFSKAGYRPTSMLIDFLVYFYNMKIKFPNVDVHFNIKKTLKDNPHNLSYEQFCKLLNVSNICPFGEYDNRHMVLLADDKNNIYGVMDDYIEHFGNDCYKMLNQLYNR